MRSLLVLAAVALTCAPTAPAEPTAPAPRFERPRSSVRLAAPTFADEAVPTQRFVVSLAPEEPWVGRARDAWEISDHAFLDLLVPPLEVWPDDPLSQAFAHALCADAPDCDDIDEDEVWSALADEVEAAGLSTEHPGTEGTAWERYATLWLRYAESDGFFMEDDDRDAIEAGLLDTLEAVPDGPLRAPLILASILMDPGDDETLIRDLTWELVEEHDEAFAIVGMEVLLEAGEPSDAFDGLDFEADGPLELHRRRLALERAAAGKAGFTSAARSVLDHPLAQPEDRMDVDELQARAQASDPSATWAKALVAEAAACADLTAGESVHLRVRGGQWRSEGEGGIADCLYGWSWPDPLPDQDVTVTVVR